MWLGWVAAWSALAAPTVTPTKAAGPLTIDGVLDEADWARAVVVSPLTQFNPQAGGPEFGTQLRVLVDEGGLTFGFDVHTVPDTALNAPLVPRDESGFHNWIGVVLDTYSDGQRGFVFRTSASGVQADAVMTSSNNSLWMMDMSWDAIYQSAARPRTDGDGYTAEIRIPFRSLRYAPGPDQVWRLLVVHFTPTPWAVYTWPALSKDEAGVLEQGALLGPFDPPKPRLPFEVLPTLTVTVPPEQDRRVLDPGVSLKAGLTSGLTLDLALNEDFSQIEADPGQVTANLKYALYLQEKRPSFLEGSDYFETPIEVFYSRSVVDPLFTVRLTGRVGPVPVGALAAWDQDPSGTTLGDDTATGQPRELWRVDDDHQAAVFVGRTGMELDNGTRVGLLAVDKTLVAADGERLQNTVIGVDANAQLADRWQAEAQVLTSQTDQDDGDVLRGSAWRFELNRQAEQLFFGAAHSYLAPGFRAEAGYLNEVDRVSASAWGGASIYTPPFRFLTVTLDADATWTTGGELVGAELGPTVETLVGERTYVEARFELQREQVDNLDFNLVRFGGFGGFNPTTRSFVGMSIDLGTGVDYASLAPGFYVQPGFFVEGSLFGRLRLNYSGAAYAFWDQLGGERVYAGLLNRLDSTLFVTPEASIRWIVEQDGFTDRFTSNLLLSWKLNHGTAAYLGYQETVDTLGWASTQRALFAKVGVLYRPGEPIFPGVRRPGASAARAQARSPHSVASIE